ncbi:hypothetical protein Tco_0906768 [Tanacetum coccineum]|uniref:Uncharacterized protein n=1 Tax=Tanacetum coccineum TaxID=301880 RepID=A0ABQ5CJQ9_9ASTR
MNLGTDCSLGVWVLIASKLEMALSNFLTIIDDYIKGKFGKAKPVSSEGTKNTGYTRRDEGEHLDDSKPVEAVNEIISILEGLPGKLENSLVSRKSKKQLVLARSSAEAEYKAMNSVTCEVIWIMKALNELKVKVSLPGKVAIGIIKLGSEKSVAQCSSCGVVCVKLESSGADRNLEAIKSHSQGCQDRDPTWDRFCLCKIEIDHLLAFRSIAIEAWKEVMAWWKVSGVFVSSVDDAALLADRVFILAKLKKDFDVVVNTTLWHMEQCNILVQVSEKGSALK